MSITSPKYLEEEKNLPEERRPFFKQLVEEYEYLTKLKFGRGYVAYAVLADLIRAGWRPSENKDPDSKI